MLALPFEDGSFDAAVVGFGSATSTTSRRALRELRRVLRPGGRLGILEITTPRGSLAPFYRLWFDRVVPLLGRVLPGGDAYTYLPASVPPLPRRPRSSPSCSRACGFARRAVPAACRGYRRRCTYGEAAYVTQRRSPTSAPVPGLERLSRRARGAARAHRRDAIPASSPRSGTRRSRPAASGCGRRSSSSPRRPGRSRRSRPASRSSSCTWRRSSTTTSSTARHFRRGKAAAWSVYGAGRRARDRRLPLRARVRRAERDRRRRGRRDPRRRDALPRARRGAAADADARPGDDRRGVPRALRAQDREAVRGRLPARRRLRRVRPRARDRVPDRRRRPRLLGRDDRDGQDRRHRPARRHADAAAPARGAAGRRRARSARRAARWTARSCALPRPARSTRSREVALDYARQARARLDGELHRDELEALTHAVVDRER